MRALVTGGCGFIGSALVRRLVADGHHVLNLDKLTYAGDPRTVAVASGAPTYQFRKIDVVDQSAIGEAIGQFAPDCVFHLAAESHVDRSIDDPGAFIDTNLRGTFVMLNAALSYWTKLDGSARARFRFVQVSTDEVFGSLGDDGHFNEDTAYRPNSPYSASKAGADHLARAWHVTYGLPTIVSNCSNNYGPFQNREKFIPTIVRKALLGQPIPIYGQGRNVRDWLQVDDHVAALLAARDRGLAGASYLFGGGSEIANLDLTQMICAMLDAKRPRADGAVYADQITFVSDRPGHDHRYAIDARRAQEALGWRPVATLASGLSATIDWYLANPEWTLGAGDPDDRLGLSAAAAWPLRGAS